MVRLSIFLPVALAATAVNAQFGDFIKNAFGGGIAQKPLGSALGETVVTKNTHDITSANWRSAVNVTVDPSVSPEDAQEWLFYFTTRPLNATGARNVTYWDGIYNETVYSLSTAKPTSKYHFGKVDCSSSEAQDLCMSFFLSAAYKVPVFYHIATYISNGTTEIRRIPWQRNVTQTEQPAFIVNFLTQKEWKEVQPWTGILSPIDSPIKDYTHYLGTALKYYEMMPQWLFMITISMIGRTVTSRIGPGRNAVGPRPTAAAPAS